MKIPRLFLHERLKALEYNHQQVLYVHEKIDGHRLTFVKQHKDMVKDMFAFTMGNIDLWPSLTEKAKKHDIWPWLARLASMPNKSSIDGELYLPGRKASDVKTAIKESDPELQFCAFAVPYWEYDRLYTSTLEWAMSVCTNLGLQFSSFHKLDTPGPVDVTSWLAACPPEIEGYVLKAANYHKWYKIKPVKTVDAVVTGIAGGKGKYEGMCGALLCSVYDAHMNLVEVCACSGMTDIERAAIDMSDVGRVVEVKYQEVLTHGRLRHPNFVRWREDKRPSECTISQDLELLRYWSE